ncbi:hypothetical protein MTP99_018532 [Tenebrio molitor]|nr:hypothetical protein MTP99_018532 [Tenebrio molitor]
MGNSGPVFFYCNDNTLLHRSSLQLFFKMLKSETFITHSYSCTTPAATADATPASQEIVPIPSVPGVFPVNGNGESSDATRQKVDS